MKITDKIHLLKIDFTVTITPEKVLPRFVYSIIVFGEKITIIDAGVKGSENIIYEYIGKHNRRIDEIKTLIISHSHPDHIGSANRIKAGTGCRVVGHALEKEWIENIDLQYSNRPVPGFYNLVDESVELDELLHGEEEIKLDNDISIRIINTPGHSAGSYSILFQEDKLLFTADSLPLVNDIPTYDNFTNLKKSINLIKSLQFNTLLTSWTEPLFNRTAISGLIEGGEKYMDKINGAVKKYYSDHQGDTMDCCRMVIQELQLPPLFAIPLVDRAFKTH